MGKQKPFGVGVWHPPEASAKKLGWVDELSGGI